MVIPYMSMLVPPQNWSGYDIGAYLCLPSYAMRTHGAKQQRQAVKRVQRNQLEPVFEVPMPCVLRSSSPETAISHMPVHQNGDEKTSSRSVQITCHFRFQICSLGRAGLKIS